MSHTSQPPFVVHVMWHPDSESCGRVADRIRTHFQSHRFRHVAGGETMEVLYHTDEDPSVAPFGVKWDVACPIAVVVLIDHRVAGHSEWVRYVGSLGEQAAAEGLRTRMIPVAMEPSVLCHLRLDQQAMRWDNWTGAIEDRGTRLLRELAYEFARMLRHYQHTEGALGPHLQKTNIFLSHSKHDAHGERVANAVRDWLHGNSALSSFLDVHDIPAGLRFPDVIDHQVEHSVMLAIYTDSYSSREWCRREVIEAKRRGVPMVVADCLVRSDERAFPYLGNVPVVRMNPSVTNCIPRVVARLVDEILRGMLWRSLVEGVRHGHAHPTFIGHPPEFVSLASRKVAPGRPGVIVHPDPPLGDAERELLGSIWNGMRFLSMTQWLADNP